MQCFCWIDSNYADNISIDRRPSGFSKKCPGLPILRVGEDIMDRAIGLHYIFGSQVSTIPRTMPLYIEKGFNINVVVGDQ